MWWRREQETPLRVRCFLGDEPPPTAHVTSVRGVVFRGGEVLVMRNPDGVHVLPGGRRETGETLHGTLRREVLEEAGWEVEAGEMLGCIHFHHLGPKPPNHRHPYPDFMQVVFLAEAARYEPGSRLSGDYEVEAGFRPVSEAERLDLSPGVRLFLDAAIRLREGG